MITKSDDRAAGVGFVNHEYDNCTGPQMIPVPQNDPKTGNDHQIIPQTNPRTEIVSSPQRKEMSGLRNLDSGFISSLNH